MTSHRHLIPIALISAVLVPFCQAQEISLFNGRDLTGWEGLKQFWSVKDGAITAKATSKNASKGNTFLVWKGGEVADFELTLKFRIESDNPEHKANSGIQFRAVMTDASRLALRGYQAELDAGTLHPDVWPPMANITGCLLDDPGPLMCAVGKKSVSMNGPTSTGQLMGVAPTQSLGSLGTELSVPNSYRNRDWNECKIIAQGNHIQTFVNGIIATDTIDDGNRYTRGLLGLQLHNPVITKTLQFKDIKLRVLTGAQMQPAAIAGTIQTATIQTATIQTDANQPRIEVIKDQGPNATEWALTPLEEAIPGDIRQNLTYLREDLLDESKKAPKATAAAYTLASDYCDKILSALDQRDLARVNAGYTAAQANAGIRVTSQALEARRNYQMSWPQYAREKDQRNEIFRQQASGADLKKERVKVDWANRVVKMRSYLDDLYAKLRAEMR